VSAAGRSKPRGGAPARILEVTSYPPPRAGWGIRVEFLKRRLECEGHECVVLNIGTSRRIPSAEYETVMDGLDFVRKVWRYSRRGFIVHAHANGDSPMGLLLALTAELLNLACGRRCYLTFHAGVIQRHFPMDRNWMLAPLFWLLFTIPSRIICNSEAVRTCIAKYGINADKIVPIPAFSKEYLEFTPVPLPAILESFLQRWETIVFTYVRMRVLFYPVTLIEGMAKVMRERPDVGLVICGGLGHADQGVWPAVQSAIQRHNVQDRICFVDDLDHDAFLTTLRRSAVYLRTPITDGVASSVLEALALGVPVVACQNGTRPSGVVTYPAEDPERLARAVMLVLDRRFEIAAAVSAVEIPDTVSDEVRLLTA
jgi:glycosyltransferase involved in cell wall biosynthesis